MKSFAPNGYGLYDMASNIQEWVADWYADDYYSVSATNNPLGPDAGLQCAVRRLSFPSER